jgi:hypothetical protein
LSGEGERNYPDSIVARSDLEPASSLDRVLEYFKEKITEIATVGYWVRDDQSPRLIIALYLLFAAIGFSGELVWWYFPELWLIGLVLIVGGALGFSFFVLRKHPGHILHIIFLGVFFAVAYVLLLLLPTIRF